MDWRDGHVRRGGSFAVLRLSTSSPVIGDCSNGQAGFSLMRMRLAQVATGDCKDLLWTIVALKETDSEGFDRNVVFHCFGDDFVYKNLPIVR